MPLLFYWRPDNHRRDLDFGAGYHLNQGNPLLHELDLGDSLWAFTRSSKGAYALAAELVVRAKTLNPSTFRYGKYRVWGDLERSRYFRVEDQDDLENVLRSVSGRTSAKVLARAFQGHAAVCRIDETAHRVLTQIADKLRLETRAQILPEERLETVLRLGDASDIERLIRVEQPGIIESRRTYLYERLPARNRRLVQELQKMYQGKCQICLWDPRGSYGQPLCEGHHIVWLSRGGNDELANMALICPNHHRAVHSCDAPLDYHDLTFCFGDLKRERLQMNHHISA